MSDQHFFDYAAEANLTKHLGNIEATDLLIKHCHINENSKILDVGCGVGQTPAYIAKHIGAHVTGVDINPGMVKRSKQRAEKQGVEHLTEFRVADAQQLPFPDNTFDAVFTESVTAFPPDKQRAVNEYTRVTKPGGYLGLNESTWLKTPPPQEILDWVSQEVGATVTPQTDEEWTKLLKNAGLIITHVEVNEVKVKEETQGIIKRYGYTGMIGSLVNALRMYLTNPEYRHFVKQVQQQGITPPNISEYFGYGLYIAQKPYHEHQPTDQ